MEKGVSKMGNKININKRVLMAIALVSLFLLLVAALLASYYVMPGQAPDWLKFLIVHHAEFMMTIAIAGILVGAAVAYLAFEKVEEKTKESKINTQMLLGFLSSEEKKTVEFLLENQGKAYQNEISRLPMMTRLKAHRTINKLSDKNIISVERHGKANKLKLAEQIYDALRQ